MVNCSTRTIIVREGDLSDLCSLIFDGKMGVFGFTSKRNCHVPRKTGETPTLVVDFLREERTLRKNIMKIVEDFVEKSYNNNNDNPWKSWRILRVKTKTLEIFKVFVFVFALFFMFLLFLFLFIHCSAFSFIFFMFPFFVFLFTSYFSFFLSFFVSNLYFLLFFLFLPFFIFIFSIFLCFFIFFFFFLFCCVSHSFLLFSDAKNRENSSKSSCCKNDNFLFEHSIGGLGGHGG